MKKSSKIVLLFGLVLCLTLITGGVLAAGPTGAIFTTTPDGTIVNENVRYESKLEVYLDGGPGPNAPQTAAGLDDGWYVFQVTDPSGKYLLSEDPSKCRVVEVLDGVITRLVNPTEFSLSDGYIPTGNGNPDPIPTCHIQDDPDGEAGESGRHDTNIDSDHGLPAIVVQLMPFGTTPNPGGVYKAWMEKYDTYLSKDGDLDNVPTALNGSAKKDCPDFCADRDPGFGPANTDTKTDNFKVREKKKMPEPPEITVRKFHDRNFNGVWDEGEEEVYGWYVEYTDPELSPGFLYTPDTIIAALQGNYSFTEDTPAGTLQTVSILDDAIVSLFPLANPVVDVYVAADYSMKDQETHEVIYGNVGLGDVTACKYYDPEGDGVVNEDLPLAGWKMELSGTLANGDSFGPVYGFTGEDGCVTFGDLLPGNYTITELFPTSVNWETTGPTYYDFEIVSTLDGSTMSGGSYTFDFTNFCYGEADFGTKGFWHNKNGLDLITDEDIAYVNGLDPYAAPSTYFTYDEPFDGFWSGGLVPAAFNNDKISDGVAAGEGTPRAEISHFLTDSNATGDPREQLAQQLLAFIFNVRYWGAGSVYYDGAWHSTADLIDAAIDAWNSGTPSEQTAIKDILDSLNNNDSVPVIFTDACYFSYD